VSVTFREAADAYLGSLERRIAASDFRATTLRTYRHIIDKDLREAFGAKRIAQVAQTLRTLREREHFADDDALVFIDDVGDWVGADRLYRRFVAAAEAAGLPRLRFHDLRHSFGTMAVQAFPLTDVKAYMGHADISTTMVYAHHVPQADAAAKLGAFAAERTKEPTRLRLAG